MNTIPSYFESQPEMNFVRREIEKITLCNEFAELYLKHNEDACITDCDNIFFQNCDNCGEEIDHDFVEGDNCPHCNEEMLSLESELKEVMQWFLVDNYQARKLSEIGEVILTTDSHTLWGRTCCGQAIELDGTFQEIYRNLK